jgi:hypothetical protein
LPLVGQINERKAINKAINSAPLAPIRDGAQLIAINLTRATIIASAQDHKGA